MEEVDPIFGSQWMIPYEQCVAMCDLIQKYCPLNSRLLSIFELCYELNLQGHFDLLFLRVVAQGRCLQSAPTVSGQR